MSIHRLSDSDLNFSPSRQAQLGTRIHTVADVLSSSDNKVPALVYKVNEATKLFDEKMGLGRQRSQHLSTYLESMKKANQEAKKKVDEIMKSSQLSIEGSDVLHETVSKRIVEANLVTQHSIPSLVSDICSSVIFSIGWLKKKCFG